MTEEVTIGQLIEQYEDIKERRKQAEAIADKLKEQQDAVEHKIIKTMEELNLEKAAHHGVTVEPKRDTYPHVEDWAQFYDFIIENKYLHLLEKRPTVTGYRELLAMGRAVPGVVPFVKTRLSVRTA